ncbi:MAG: hypothetical protein AAEI08_03955, partial [Gammaproteobacteria bacterium]
SAQLLSRAVMRWEIETESDENSIAITDEFTRCYEQVDIAKVWTGNWRGPMNFEGICSAWHGWSQHQDGLSPTNQRNVNRIEAEEKSGKISVTRFKGLGEMNPSQLRETTMAADTRRLVQLTVTANDKVDQLMDMLLAKKRAPDRKEWLREKGNLADV